MKHSMMIYLHENVLLLMHLLLPPFLFNCPMQSYALEVRTRLLHSSEVRVIFNPLSNSQRSLYMYLKSSPFLSNPTIAEDISLFFQLQKLL